MAPGHGLILGRHLGCIFNSHMCKTLSYPLVSCGGSLLGDVFLMQILETCFVARGTFAIQRYLFDCSATSVQGEKQFSFLVTKLSPAPTKATTMGLRKSLDLKGVIQII